MSRIKRYQFAQGSPLPKNMHLDGGWIKGGAMGYIGKTFVNKLTDSEFSICIAFDRDMTEWNDFDNVLITDSWSSQYTPFYEFWDEEVDNNAALQYVIETYNDYMDSLPFLEPLEVTF